MPSIERNPEAFANERYDVIVIGGGIYGASMLLEASRRGLKSLLIERDDFGGATSWNSLRIIHGGLRYLQKADLPRFRRSVVEQAWWLHNFPDLVEPMSCLMPLYNRGLRRSSVMKWALRINDSLANAARIKTLGTTSIGLERGRIIDSAETQQRFPQVDVRHLKGGALWFDAKMTAPQRLLVEVLRWSVGAGGRAANYMTCTGFTVHKGRVVGVKAKCGVTAGEFEFSARHVVNCAGPWAKEVASGQPGAYKQFASAFNIVLDRLPLSRDAIALTRPIASGSTYFVVPYGRRMMIGTVHLAANEPDMPTDSRISAFLDELNLAVPGLDISPTEVVQVLPGRLPPAAIGSHLPSKSPRIEHHAKTGGPKGITSVQGVKYTTARFIAERTLREIFRDLPSYSQSPRPTPAPTVPLSSNCLPTAYDLRNWISDESVVHIDDLLLRRCDLSLGPLERLALGKRLMELAEWNSACWPDELARLQKQHTSYNCNTVD